MKPSPFGGGFLLYKTIFIFRMYKWVVFILDFPIYKRLIIIS